MTLKQGNARKKSVLKLFLFWLQMILAAETIFNTAVSSISLWILFCIFWTVVTPPIESIYFKDLVK